MKSRWNWLEGLRRVLKVEKATTTMQASREIKAGKDEDCQIVLENTNLQRPPSDCVMRSCRT